MQTTNLIIQLIDDSAVVPYVQSLDEHSLLRLINHIGLEDAGHIAAMATGGQLTRIFDTILWKGNGPGKAETFDPNEFGIWMEIMQATSPQDAVRYALSMDEELLLLGLTGNLLVVDNESLLLRMQNASRSHQDDLLEKVLESHFFLEWGDFLVLAGNNRYWDALINLLVDLGVEDSVFTTFLLERLCMLTTDYIEDNGGLYNVLTATETLETDLAAEREERRAHQGYVPPETAGAFLEQARCTPLEQLLTEQESDCLTRAYFAALQAETVGPRENVTPMNAEKGTASATLPVLQRQLVNAGIVVTEQPSLVIDAVVEGEGDVLNAVLREMRNYNSDQFDRCISELHYPANVVVSAEAINGRPVEAARYVIRICSKGASYSLSPHALSNEAVRELLCKESLVKMFRIGYHLEN